MSVSSEVVIMTRSELETVKGESYQRGVRRGEFEVGRKHCRGGRDGECSWWLCPQNQAGEPAKTGRHCPLDNELDRD